MKMHSKLPGLGLALLAGGCSWLPDIGGGAPNATNPAIDACLQAAGKEGAEKVAEHQAMPGENGRYTVEIGISDENGNRVVTCDYDPGTGPRLRKGRASVPKG